MARAGKLPTSEWPWSAAMAPRWSAVGVGSIGSVARRDAARTRGRCCSAPLRGQAESAVYDPERLPDRGTPEGAAWEPLYRALMWDMQTIVKWIIGPRGWISPSGASAGQAKETGTGGPAGDGAGKDLPVPQAAGGHPVDAPGDARRRGRRRRGDPRRHLHIRRAPQPSSARQALASQEARRIRRCMDYAGSPWGSWGSRATVSHGRRASAASLPGPGGEPGPAPAISVCAAAHGQP